MLSCVPKEGEKVERERERERERVREKRRLCIMCIKYLRIIINIVLKIEMH